MRLGQSMKVETDAVLVIF